MRSFQLSQGFVDQKKDQCVVTGFHLISMPSHYRAKRFFVGKKVGSIPYGPYDMEHMKFVETYSRLNFKLARKSVMGNSVVMLILT